MFILLVRFLHKVKQKISIKYFIYLKIPIGEICMSEDEQREFSFRTYWGSDSKRCHVEYRRDKDTWIMLDPVLFI